MKKYMLLALAFVAQPALAQDEGVKMSGLRVEARLGWETPTVSDGSVYKLGNSVSAGAEIGYDVKVSNTVTVGPYFTYDYASAETCDGAGNCLGSDGNWVAGARLGFNVGERAQIYVKGGYDQFRLKAAIPGATGTETLNGPGGAIGVDFAISKSAYAGFEANYADLGSFAGINFQRRHVAAKVGMRF
ncbi:MAG: outer membrane beta-barrel protein [Novosphingobium sp.]